MSQTTTLLLPWKALSCRAGARSLKVSEAAATAARQPGGGREEGGGDLCNNKTKQNTAKTIFCHTKFYHSFFFSLVAGGCGLLEEADLEMGSRLLPDDPEVA